MDSAPHVTVKCFMALKYDFFFDYLIYLPGVEIEHFKVF